MADRNDSDVLTMLGRAATGLTLETMPPEVLQRSKQRVLDTIGCLVAGYNEGVSEAIREYVLGQGGKPEATLLPGGQKTTAALAGLAHATYIFGLELSDAAPRGTVHPGCEIVMIALALAERHGLGGAAILPAVVAGYETEIRFGRALHPHAFYKGWSTIGLLGSIGPAVTSAHMMGLDAERMGNTIGACLSLTPAATGRVSQGGSVKWVVGGHACSTGLFAAELGARGITGHRDVSGLWLKVISEEHHPERLTEGITSAGTFEEWEILSGVVTKYYAAVGPLAAAIEATFQLVDTHDIAADEVVEIHADCMRRTAMFNNPRPSSNHTARASLPFCLAVAVLTRDPRQLLGPAYQRLEDPAILAMADRVRITENEDYERRYPAQSLVRINIRMKNGESHTLEVDRSTIDRYLRPSDADIEGKFRMIATPVLGEIKTDTVVKLVQNMERMVDVTALIDALQPGK